MDVIRPHARRNRMLRQSFALGGVGAGGLALTLWLARLGPAVPAVERATLLIDTVQHGDLLRQIRSPGSLVPEEIWWITASTEGLVENVPLKAGEPVLPDTILVVLSNQELEQAAQEAELQVKAAEAELTNLRVLLQSQLLDQESAAAALQADFEQSNLQLEADEQLAKKGLISEINLKLSRLRAKQLGTRVKIEAKRIEISAQGVKAQLAVQQARLEQLRATFDLRKRQVEALKVRAGNRGVLQQLQVQVGQRVTPGLTLAKVVQPERLKAELRVPESQAKDVQIDQAASIDTRNGMVPGRVSRLDPSVHDGIVTVDVEMSGALPKGVRPDLSIDGTIEIERLQNVLYVGRPALGPPDSTVSLFRLTPDGSEAFRVQVELGRASVRAIEVRQGLREGEQVILSETSAWDGFNHIRIR